jgi:hypothetical protein
MSKLYVFLHGLYVTKQTNSMIQVVMPLVKGHVYRAGSWLLESDIPHGRTLNLSGVTAGSSDIKNQQKIIHLPGLRVTGRSQAATVWLPAPDNILQFCDYRRPPDSAFAPNLVPKLKRPKVVQRNDNSTGWNEIASVNVLEYTGVDMDRVQLEGHPWEPYVIDDAISLHFISTSLTQEGQVHLAETEAVLHRIIDPYPGLTFELFTFNDDWRTTPVGPLVDWAGAPEQAVATSATPPGRFAFSRAELEDIPSRTARINRLGRIKQDGRPPALLWHETQALAAEPSNCGPIDVS